MELLEWFAALTWWQSLLLLPFAYFAFVFIVLGIILTVYGIAIGAMLIFLVAIVTWNEYMVTK